MTDTSIITTNLDLTAAQATYINGMIDLGDAIEGTLNDMSDDNVVDKVWFLEGTKYLKLGLMCIKRSIARPENF